MAKGISLHIGVNEVDPNHYQGWSGPLNACEADAEDMRQISVNNEFESNILLTSEATREGVISGIERAAEALRTGDIFFLSYSGHGGQVPDLKKEEEDGLDETWCLYNGQLIDDELHELWARFADGVRILVLSDSCHSGTVVRAAMTLASTAPDERELRGQQPVYRFMPPNIALRTYRANRQFYDGMAKDIPKTKSPVQATVRLISGCQDNQFSLDGIFNGKFTGTLLSVWNEGGFEGHYARFHRKIVEQMPATQTPNHYIIGAASPEYDAQKPFQI